MVIMSSHTFSLFVSDTEELEEIAEFIEENAPVIAPIALITTITPPPLPMFPPQGVPQPTSTLSGGSPSGGGFTPGPALAVGNSFISIMLIDV